ncbi:MAG: uncharacterized protein A8A55_0864 [Amphiamblys sp. WSBS2006]|nr:MAG: uncharacterized protein A8A55_0864 [Amphiamblys sp. WSBS2006]
MTSGDEKKTHENPFAGFKGETTFGDVSGKTEKDTFKEMLKQEKNETERREEVLEKKEIMTGEEDETCVFCDEGVLYVFDSASTEWRSRGKGEVKICENTDTKKRVIVRSEGSMRVLANSKVLFPEKTIQKAGEKSVRLLMDFDGTGQACLIRFGSGGVCSRFLGSIQKQTQE